MIVKTKKNRTNRYLVPYSLAIYALIGNFIGGYWSFLSLVIAFGIHPILEDLFFKYVKCFPTPNKLIYNLYIWFMVPFLFIFLGLNLYFIKSAEGITLIGIIISTGAIMGIIGITVSHELIHRINKIEKFLGYFLLSLVNFTHWGAEHIEWHHKWVGTPKDSATARINEPVYLFWFRDYFHGLKNNFMNELQINSGIKNRYFKYTFAKVFWIFLILYFANTKVLLSWFAISVVAILLLSTIDYIEHYGLERKMINGKFEPVQPEHSWDSYQAATNFALFKLGYHSHHHLKPRIPYPELSEQASARILPYGYSTMVLLALIPPLYFKVMNQKIEANREVS
jgi:alkane 1-monooxygenase